MLINQAAPHFPEPKYSYRNKEGKRKKEQLREKKRKYQMERSTSVLWRASLVSLEYEEVTDDGEGRRLGSYRYP